MSTGEWLQRRGKKYVSEQSGGFSSNSGSGGNVNRRTNGGGSGDNRRNNNNNRNNNVTRTNGSDSRSGTYRSNNSGSSPSRDDGNYGVNIDQIAKRSIDAGIKAGKSGEEIHNDVEEVITKQSGGNVSKRVILVAVFTRFASYGKIDMMTELLGKLKGGIQGKYDSKGYTPYHTALFPRNPQTGCKEVKKILTLIMNSPLGNTLFDKNNLGETSLDAIGQTKFTTLEKKDLLEHITNMTPSLARAVYFLASNLIVSTDQKEIMIKMAISVINAPKECATCVSEKSKALKKIQLLCKSHADISRAISYPLIAISMIEKKEIIVDDVCGVKEFFERRAPIFEEKKREFTESVFLLASETYNNIKMEYETSLGLEEREKAVAQESVNETNHLVGYIIGELIINNEANAIKHFKSLTNSSDVMDRIQGICAVGQFFFTPCGKVRKSDNINTDLEKEMRAFLQVIKDPEKGGVTPKFRFGAADMLKLIG